MAATYGVYRSQLTINRVQECIVAAERHRPGAAPASRRPRPPSPGSSPATRSSRSTASRSGLGRHVQADPGNLDHPAQVTVERAGDRIELPPVNTVITGVPDRYDPAKRVAAGFFGVEPQVVRERGGPVVVLGDMWTMTKQTAVALAAVPGQGLLHRPTTWSPASRGTSTVR